MQIELQESVLKTQVKWSDFKQKKQINGLINEYKKNISLLEAQREDLRAPKQSLELKVSKLAKELDLRSMGIIQRINHYKFIIGDYPETMEDITKLEHQEQMKQEQAIKQKQQIQQPTVGIKEYRHTMLRKKNDKEIKKEQHIKYR